MSNFKFYFQDEEFDQQNEHDSAPTQNTIQNFYPGMHNENPLGNEY